MDEFLAGKNRIFDGQTIDQIFYRGRSGPQFIHIIAMLASYACIAYNTCMQYTIRRVPNSLDAALRRRAREQGKSLNEVAVEALARGAGVSGEPSRQRDLRDIAGTWHNDRAFDRAVAAQDTVDKELWQ